MARVVLSAAGCRPAVPSRAAQAPRRTAALLPPLLSRPGTHSHYAFRQANAVALAIPVSGPGQQPDAGGDSGGADGQMTAELMATMTSKIGEALETESVNIVDVYGDGRHVSIDVVSELFEGKSSMQRQRLVYKAIWFELQDAVHAVDSMTTKTPTEVA
eukprot:jgi/Tetstr1/435952/TSEL_024833.t1